MHKNRLIELSQISGDSNRIGSKLKEPLHIEKVEEGQFDHLLRLIKKFSFGNQQISELWNEYKKTANPVKQKQITHKVSKIAQKNTKMMEKIDKEIKDINETFKKDVSQGNKGKGMKVMQVTQSARKAISDFKQIQAEFTNGVKDGIRRQATIMQGDISEQEVESIMEHPEKGQQMLEAKLYNPSAQLQNAVSDIIDKYRDVVALEKNMNECLEMMKQMALLVNLQSQQLKNIEETVDTTGDYMQNAEKKLSDAKDHHKSAKKKICCIIMLLLAVIGAILIPVLLTR